VTLALIVYISGNKMKSKELWQWNPQFHSNVLENKQMTQGKQSDAPEDFVAEEDILINIACFSVTS